MDDSDVSAWQTSVKPRALVVGSMIKHCKDRLQARAEIHDFISNMKEDVEKTSRDLSEEDQDSREWYIRKKSCASFLYLKHRDVERLNQITEEVKIKQLDTAFFSPSDSIDLVVVLSPFKGISFLEKRMTLKSVGSQPLCIMAIFHLHVPGKTA